MNKYHITDEELNIVAHQFIILSKFLYHYRSYKELLCNYQKLIGDQAFWVSTIDAHLMQCFNYWCMVFGSDKNNDTHWKNLKFNLHEGEDGFDKRLFNELNINKEEWKIAWKEIIDFRNKYTAHRDIGFSRPVPYLDYAYKTVFIYDKWLIEEIFPSNNWIINEAALYVFEAEHLERISNTINQLINDQN
jgi:hypothetical protein